MLLIPGCSCMRPLLAQATATVVPGPCGTIDKAAKYLLRGAVSRAHSNEAKCMADMGARGWHLYLAVIQLG
eukprot:scaffold153056_cov19-Tisochrysis_lutea.AAC.1